VIFSGKKGAQQIFDELAAAFRVVGGNRLVFGVEAESAVLPVQELAGRLPKWGEVLARGANSVICNRSLRAAFKLVLDPTFPNSWAFRNLGLRK
jgi:hypothetical protein